jgi:hypothetical protein
VKPAPDKKRPLLLGGIAVVTTGLRSCRQLNVADAVVSDLLAEGHVIILVDLHRAPDKFMMRFRAWAEWERPLL